MNAIWIITNSVAIRLIAENVIPRIDIMEPCELTVLEARVFITFKPIEQQVLARPRVQVTARSSMLKQIMQMQQ